MNPGRLPKSPRQGRAEGVGAPDAKAPGTPPENAGGAQARGGLLALVRRAPRLALRGLILVYRYSLSAFMGRQCRYLPTCSEYAEEAVMRHGALAGSVMATARICRCNPWGGHGYDPVPRCLPADARWYRPWRYGIWRMPPEAGAPAQAQGQDPNGKQDPDGKQDRDAK